MIPTRNEPGAGRERAFGRRLLHGRPRHGNDSRLAQTKNGAVVRKVFGDPHIPQRHAAEFNTVCREYLDPFLSFHRPCLFATEAADPNKPGRLRRVYRPRDAMTPLEKLASLSNAAQCLRAGNTSTELRELGSALSDVDPAKELAEARQALLKRATTRAPPKAARETTRERKTRTDLHGRRLHWRPFTTDRPAPPRPTPSTPGSDLNRRRLEPHASAMPIVTPRVSVVIASYNHAAFVGECLASVLAQTYEDWELVVTDDGSTDGTADAVRAFAAAHPQARIDFEALPENRGACIALNHGVRRARGEFIAILNSDDLFLPHKLARQVAFLDDHPQIGAVFGWPELVDERGAPFADPTHKDTAVFRQPNRPRQAWLRHFFDHGNALCHPTVLIRRRCYDEVGRYDPRLAQVPDFDLWIRLAMRHEIHVLAEPLIRFRILDAQRNASAARPVAAVRDAWERRHVLDRFLGIGAPDFAAAFPEYAGRPESRAVLLAQRALGFGYPFHLHFALDTLYRHLAADGDGPEYAAFIRLTGAIDLYRLFPEGTGAP